MALHQVLFDDVRASCRKKLDSCELWLKRIVHDQLKAVFGISYLDATLNGKELFNAKTRNTIVNRLSNNDFAEQRAVDGMTFGEIADIICNGEVFDRYFADCFTDSSPYCYPFIRIILRRINKIRHDLAHTRQISLHDAERILCYCDDIILSISTYYRKCGMEREFNAPTFIRFSDSLGNDIYLHSSKRHLDFHSSSILYIGQTIRLEVEVDTFFDPSTYTIDWIVNNITNGERGIGYSFTLVLTHRHVNEYFTVSAILASNELWHRHGNFDAMLSISYKVLPFP